MAIGVIADTHGDAHGWQKAVKFWCDLEVILHAGDVLSPGKSTILAEEMKQSPVPVLVASGNCDSLQMSCAVGWPVSPLVTLFWQGRLVLMSHGADFTAFRELALRCGAQVAITGHTHVASVVRDGKVLFLNPGSASAQRGRDPASFAWLDGQGATIMTLEGQVLHHEPWCDQL